MDPLFCPLSRRGGRSARGGWGHRGKWPDWCSPQPACQGPEAVACAQLSPKATPLQLCAGVSLAFSARSVRQNGVQFLELSKQNRCSPPFPFLNSFLLWRSSPFSSSTICFLTPRQFSATHTKCKNQFPLSPPCASHRTSAHATLPCFPDDCSAGTSHRPTCTPSLDDYAAVHQNHL